MKRGAVKKIRLDKFLSHMRLGSRREVKEMVRAGLVSVNGETVRDSGLVVDPERDLVAVDGQPVFFKEYIYLMMNKPAGYLSATKDDYGPTVIDLLSPDWSGWELFPVGRLDKDTEGLLLLTNDGRLAHSLLSPRAHVPKTYYLRVEGEISSTDAERLECGVVLDDGYRTMPAGVRILHTGEVSELELTIYEGKFHQVKRMLASLGKRVTYLRRIAMGGLELDPGLAPGEVRELTEAELKLLRS